jgi:hypothetical protein
MTPWFEQVKQATAAGHFTYAQERCLYFLQTFRGRGGHVFPSHETIAARAGPSVSTVQRTLKIARGLGLVEWAERRVRVGWRWFRTSNAYRLLMSEKPMKPTAGQPDRVTLRVSTFSLSSGVRKEEKRLRERHAVETEAMLQAAKRGPDLLKRRREQFLRGAITLAN